MTDTTPKRRYYAIAAPAVALMVLIGVGLLLFGRDDKVTLPISVRFTHIPSELLVVGNVPVLEALVKGPSGLLKGLKDLQLSHEIDLVSAEPGRQFIKILPETITVPQGASVLEVDPDSFTISIERRVEKLVPVVPDLINEPVPGYIVASVVASPSRIELSGPASMLEKISAVRTTPVNLAGLTGSAKKKVALNLRHSPYVQPTENSLVEIEIVVVEKIIEESIITAVQGTGTNYTYEIRPDRIELILRGPEKTMKKLLQGNGIRVRVDLKGLTPGTYKRHAVIEPPLNTTLVEAKPEVFTVELHE